MTDGTMPKDSSRFFTGSHEHPYLTAMMDNVLAWRLGEACEKAAKASAGDYIDRGLILLMALGEQGFSVTPTTPPPAR